uniref:Zinc finger and BTB domain containing 24 n=1 Tax=Oryzias latipes TaxID=8090 RepID=A0A3B3HNP6_ORYLA
MSRKGPASPLVAARSHEQRVLRRFDELRREEQLCDVTLVVEDVRFKAHKALLAASSDFFSVMFTAGEQLHPSTLRLDGMTADAFAAALDFIYGAQVRVEERAAAPLLSAARRVELGELVRALTEPSPSANSDRAGGEEEEEAGRRGGRKRHPPSEARCRDCGKVFKHHLFLQVHRRTHTGRTPQQESVTPPPTEVESWDARLLCPPGEKPFHCSACGKSFTQKHTLQAHQRVHSGERPFVCAVCSKSLSSKHSLQEHMSLHQEKTFTCDKCEKSFTQKRQLKNHYRTHTGEDTCTQPPPPQRNLQLRAPPPPPGKSLPECAECQRRFMDTAQLKKHLRTHTGKKAFTCSVCSLSFTRLDNLKTHAKTHSREGGAADAQEEPRGALLLQPPLGSEPEIQLLVTDQNLSFAAGQQEISLLAADGGKRQKSFMFLCVRRRTRATAASAAPPPQPLEMRV